MVSGPSGFALVTVIGGGAAMLMLIAVWLWPKRNDGLFRFTRRAWRIWERITGLADSQRRAP
jgi:hypothetical protein